MFSDPQETGPHRYKGPHVACEDLEKFFPENSDKVKVIDTGRVGILLIGKGFKLIDALDPCAEMLDEARKLKIYNTFICKPIGFDKLPIKDRGLVSISMKTEFLDTCSEYRGRLGPLMEKMEQDGLKFISITCT